MRILYLLQRVLAAFAVLLCPGSPAQAVHLSADGGGQVLLFPYYTANGARQTLLTIQNTSGAKALKLRFYESHNARLVFSANIYLAAMDSWTAAIYADDEAGTTPASMVSTDASCFLTDSTDVDASASVARFRFSNADYTDSNRDSGAQTLARTRTGYVEVISMANLGPALIDNDKVRCDAIRGSINSDGSFGNFSLGTSSADFTSSKGVIYGSASIVNVREGTQSSTAATALASFRKQAMHTAPGAASPNLSDADPESTVLFEDGAQTFRWGDEALGAGLPNGQRLDAVGSALIARGIAGDFSLERELGAKTELVLTFPLTRLQFPNTSAQICREYTYVGRDRELNTEGHMSSTINFVIIPERFFVCGAVVVLDMSNVASPRFARRPERTASAILGDTESYVFPTPFSAGSYAIGFPNVPRPALSGGLRQIGQAVIGFATTRIENGGARPGVAGFYETSTPHARDHACSQANSSVSAICVPTP
jgi:hypothetical protein